MTNAEHIAFDEPELEDEEDFVTQSVVKPVPRISIEVFCEQPDTGMIIQRAAEDRRLAKAHVTVHMGGIPAAVKYYSDTGTPSLIIVESRDGGEVLFNQLGGLAEVCDAGTKVIIVGHLNDITLYREMIRQGVNEYLVAPLTPIQVVDSVARLYADPEAPPIGRSIVFIGARGGVGSSTIAHNVSWCVAEEMREDVTLMDMDLPFGTAGLDFNQDPVQGVADALMQPERLDDVLLDRLLLKCTDRLSIFGAPGTLDREDELSPEACETVIETVRETCPCVVVDMPHMWSRWTRQTLLNADEIVITATPDLASLRNTKNYLDLLKKQRTNDAAPHVVLNQVRMPKRPEIPPADFAEAIEQEPTLILPFNPTLFGTASNNGQMLEEIDPKNKTTTAIRHLSTLVTGRHVQPVKKKGLLAGLFGAKTKKKG
ncbi:MAG: AAA family ATPase [Parvibaculaceae bacterium]